MIGVIVGIIAGLIIAEIYKRYENSCTTCGRYSKNWMGISSIKIKEGDKAESKYERLCESCWEIRKKI